MTIRLLIVLISFRKFKEKIDRKLKILLFLVHQDADKLLDKDSKDVLTR